MTEFVTEKTVISPITGSKFNPENPIPSDITIAVGEKVTISGSAKVDFIYVFINSEPTYMFIITEEDWNTKCEK